MQGHGCITSGAADALNAKNRQKGKEREETQYGSR